MVCETLLLQAAWSGCQWYWWQNSFFCFVFSRSRIGLPNACSMEIWRLLSVAPGVRWFFTLLCFKLLHWGLLHSSKTKAVQSMRKAYKNFTNSLLKFKSFTKGCKITAINFGVSFWSTIAFELSLALDQGNFVLHYLVTAGFCLHINW